MAWDGIESLNAASPPNEAAERAQRTRDKSVYEVLGKDAGAPRVEPAW